MPSDLLPSGMPSMDGASKIRGFWERKEGKVGIGFALALAAGLGWGLFKILPFLIILATNTLHLAVLCAAIAAIGYVIFDSRWRTLLGYIYKSFMRLITGVFVEIDPVGITKNYIEDLKKSLAEMDAQIGNLRGQMRRLLDIITENEQKIEHAVSLMKQAKKKGDAEVVTLNAREAKRLNDSNARLQDLYKRMETLYNLLTKMYKWSQVVLQDMENEVNNKVRERNAIRASYRAFRSALKILRGDTDARALYDQAMESMADDAANKFGEIEHFMFESATIMRGIDLENGIVEEEAEKLLERWEKRSEELLSPGEGVDAFSSPDTPKAITAGNSTTIGDILEAGEENAVPVARRKGEAFEGFFKQK